MRFECKVRVVNRNPGGKSCNSYIISTIALGKETFTENDYFLLHFSNTARGSLKGSRYTKYNLKKNPTKVFTKCINEGKITISFEDPSHDLFIQGEASQLSRFVELLNLCLSGEVGVLPTTVTVEAKERYNKHLNEEKQSLLKTKKKAKKSVLKNESISSKEIPLNKGEVTYNDGDNHLKLDLIEKEVLSKSENKSNTSKQETTSAVIEKEICNIHESEDIQVISANLKPEEQPFEKDTISSEHKTEAASTNVAKDLLSMNEENLCFNESMIGEEEISEPKVNTNYKRKKQKIKYRRLELWFSDSLRN